MKSFSRADYQAGEAIMEGVAKLILRQMKRQKMSLVGLVAESGLNYGTLYGSLYYHRALGLETLRRIAVALGVSTKSLLPAKR